MKSVYQKLVEKNGFSPAQKVIINSIIPKTQVLEIGCSSGYMTKEFKKMGCSVDIVEPDKTTLKRARKWAKKTLGGSIEDKKIRSKIKNKYDIIVCADVLEHLKDPEDSLKFLRSCLKKTGYILISIPNIAFWDMRKQLFFKGNFDYQESGLLDKTHLRFYSLDGFLSLLKRNNFKIVKVIPAEARLPFEYTLKKLPLLRLLLKLSKEKLIWIKPNLTFFHYVVKAYG